MTADRLVVGLVNNMPDAALTATERQFEALLADAGGGEPVRLRLFALPGVPRSPAAQAHLERHYEPINAVADGGLDGLIVTGAEPRAGRLQDEPYWRALADLVDKAEGCAIPTIWSCLAAHAAALHRDGVARRRCKRKLVGVFECSAGDPHALLAGMPAAWPVPHSRCNGLPAEPLLARGYRLLSWSRQTGPDMLARDGDSLVVLMQGHLEYDGGALYREYRRDVARFLAGKREDYPQPPHGYFAAPTAASLAAFRERAMAERDPAALADFPPAPDLPCRWRAAARRFYRNWLDCLARRRVGGRSLAAV